MRSGICLMNRTLTSVAGLLSVLMLSSLVVAPSAAQQSAGSVYKWTDPQGHVHYSDKPPPSDAKVVALEQRGMAPAGPRPRPAAPAQEASPNTPPADLNGLKGAVADDIHKVNDEQCKAAQERYQNDIRSRRIYRNGPDNQRIYLNDTELENERLEARRDVNTYCNPSN